MNEHYCGYFANFNFSCNYCNIRAAGSLKALWGLVIWWPTLPCKLFHFWGWCVLCLQLVSPSSASLRQCLTQHGCVPSARPIPCHWELGISHLWCEKGLATAAINLFGNLGDYRVHWNTSNLLISKGQSGSQKGRLLWANYRAGLLVKGGIGLADRGGPSYLLMHL